MGSVLPADQVAGALKHDKHQSLIQNLIVGLAKHLRQLKEDCIKVITFIEDEWLPNRTNTIGKLRTIIKVRKAKNMRINYGKLGLKTSSAVSKVGALCTLPILPVCVTFGAVSLVADTVSIALTIAQAVRVRTSSRKAKSALRYDLETTRKLEKLLLGYKLNVRNVEIDVEKLHEATIRGFFEKVAVSPSVGKFLRKVRTTATLTPETTAEILKEFVNAITDPQSRDDVAFGFNQLNKLNPAVRDSIKDGAEFFASSFNMTLLCSRLATGVGSLVFIGLNLLFIVSDFAEISKAVVSLSAGGIDEMVVKLEEILLRLTDEMNCIEKAVSGIDRNW